MSQVHPPTVDAPSPSNVFHIAGPGLSISELQNQQERTAPQFHIMPESPSVPRLPIQKDDDVVKIFSMLEETTKKVKVEIVDDLDQNSEESDELPIEMREECGMCFEKFGLGEDKCKLPCNHIFTKNA